MRHTLHVLLFSVLRERVGRATLTIDVDHPLTGEALLDRLAGQYPAVAALRPVIRLAVNEVYVQGSVELHDGDEVALITPVSGG